MADHEIYFAECQGRIKIGIAKNVAKRLANLRTGAGGPLNLIATIAGGRTVEKSLHAKLKSFRIDGEWYRDCSEVRAAIQNSINNFPPAPSFTEDRQEQLGRFGAVARVLWPTKTAAHLAAASRVDERTAKRWLRGEYEPSLAAILALFNKMFER